MPDDDVDWARLAEMDPTVRMMREAGLPMTRENYIDLNWGGEAPKPWNEEAEMSLPGPFQISHGR